MNQISPGSRYSASIPTDLLASYERSLRDPNLIALRDEISLLDSRMQALLSDLSAGSTNALWDSLSGLAERATLAADIITPPEAARDSVAQHGTDWTAPAAFTEEARERAIMALVGCAYQLARLCATAALVSSTWRELYDLVDLRRRLSESEQRRLVNLNATIPSDRALALITALAASIRRRVSDPATVRAISADFSAILNASIDLTGHPLADRTSPLDPDDVPPDPLDLTPIPAPARAPTTLVDR